MRVFFFLWEQIGQGVLARPQQISALDDITRKRKEVLVWKEYFKKHMLSLRFNQKDFWNWKNKVK